MTCALNFLRTICAPSLLIHTSRTPPLDRRSIADTPTLAARHFATASPSLRESRTTRLTWEIRTPRPRRRARFERCEFERHGPGQTGREPVAPHRSPPGRGASAKADVDKAFG